MNNRKIIVLLSGEIGSGKSTLGELLATHYGFHCLRTKEAIMELKKRKTLPQRASLMDSGEKLDRETNGTWVRNFFQEEILKHDRLVVDSVRISEQIIAFRESYGLNVYHIHLFASPESLEKRFIEREKNLGKSKSDILSEYKKAKSNKTEKNVSDLKANADVMIHTDRNRPQDVLTRAVASLKLFSSTNNKLVDVIVGAQFGSEGKGHMASYLGSKYDCLMRVGGPNAGHKVVGTTHTFRIL